MPAISCRPGRAERLAIGLLLLLLLALYSWAAHYRLDALDEGYFVYTSSRVLAGELPYRDFSTPYTPGFFYLNALLFRVFGLDVVTLRLSLVVARLALVVLIYSLARRLMPPAFAALPVLLFLAEDQAPSVWESHPAWWATVAFLVMVWCVCRHCERGGAGWWLAASVAAAAGFAMKQNQGLFALAALVAVALTEERSLPALRSPGRLGQIAVRLPRRLSAWRELAGGPAVLIALSSGIAWGMRPHLNPLLYVMFALPFGALAVLHVLEARRERLAAFRPGSQMLASTRVRLGLAAFGFAAATLPWLLIQAFVVGPSQTPFLSFLGAIETGGYYLALEPPRSELLPVLGLALLAPVVVLAAERAAPLAVKAGVALGGLALAAGLLRELIRPAAEVHPRVLRAAALLSVKATTNLILYLPSVAFWSAAGLLMSGRVLPAQRLTLRWFLLSGSLLLLNQYPRMDETHLLFSAPLLWIVGAYCLWRLFECASAGMRAGRALLFWRCAFYAALLLLPLAAIWPTFEARREDLLIRQPGFPPRLTTPRYVSLELRGASVAETDEFAWKYQQLASYFQEQTRPGERIFVYPAAPLLYYLVDRPNATRFNHIFPGLLSAADEQETIERLEQVPATHVIWDSFGAEYWGQPGVYQRLTDYIWDRYRPVESIGGFEILRRVS